MMSKTDKEKANCILGCIKSNTTSSSREIPLGVLHPVLRSLAQEGHGPVGVRLEEATKLKDEAPLL